MFTQIIDSTKLRNELKVMRENGAKIQGIENVDEKQVKVYYC